MKNVIEAVRDMGEGESLLDVLADNSTSFQQFYEEGDILPLLEEFLLEDNQNRDAFVSFLERRDELVRTIQADVEAEEARAALIAQVAETGEKPPTQAAAGAAEVSQKFSPLRPAWLYLEVCGSPATQGNLIFVLEEWLRHDADAAASLASHFAEEVRALAEQSGGPT